MKNPFRSLGKRTIAAALLAAALLLAGTPAEAQKMHPRSDTYIVAARGASGQSQSGADYPCAIYPTDADAIQAAISALPAGGCVLLTEGTYRLTKSITLKANLELRGEGAGVTVLLRATGTATNVDLIDGDSINSVAVRDLTIDSDDQHNTFNSAHAMTLKNMSEVQLTQVELVNTGEDGVFLNQVSNILVRSCSINDAARGGDGKGGFGLATTSNLCTNVAITNCTFRNNQCNAIYATTVNGISITNCTFTDNAFDQVMGGQIGLSNGCTNATITGCTFTDDGQGNSGTTPTPGHSPFAAGIQLDVTSLNTGGAGPVSQFVTIANNVISNEGYAGISVYNYSGTNSAYCTIKNNVISNCAYSPRGDTVGQISVAANVDHFLIEGNIVYATANEPPPGFTQRGVYVQGANQYYVIANNDLMSAASNGGTALEDDGNGGTTAVKYNNLTPKI